MVSLCVLAVAFGFVFLLNFAFCFCSNPYIEYQVGHENYRFQIEKEHNLGYVLDFLFRGRSDSFFNRPSGTFFLFTSLYQTILCLFIFYFLLKGSSFFLKEFGFNVENNFEVSPIYLSTFIMVLFGSLFWKERNDYYQKWRYLAESYKDFMFGPKDQAKMRYIDFLHDLEVMEMWGHKTYKGVAGEFLYEMGCLKKGRITKLKGGDFEGIIMYYEENYVSEKDKVKFFAKSPSKK